MDYEMKYKAVLKTATQWIKDGCTDKERICLVCVFPELAESEEQMEALESAVKLYKDTHFEIHHKKIVSLYEQLKKLKEGQQ